MDTWVWGLLVIAASILLAEILLRLFSLTVVLPIFERRPPFNVRPVGPDLDAEYIRFAATDGLAMAGSIYRPVGEPAGVVVFCPEFGGTHWSATSYVGGLIDAGFAVFAFDFRNQGESDTDEGYSPTHWLTEKDVADAAAALDYIARSDEFGDLPLGIVGVSRGGNAALAAAARRPQVRAVAAEGAFSTDAMMLYYAYRWAELYVPAWFVRLIPEWHLAETLRFARRVSGLRRGVRYAVLERSLPRLRNRPVLLITGGRDSYVAPVIPERIRRRIGPSCGPVWVVPGAKHNQGRLVATGEYDRRLVEFFSRIAVPTEPACEEKRLMEAVR
ncbi:MAG: alpha/beta hydrolase [Planctomycetaceae bacterium]